MDRGSNVRNLSGDQQSSDRVLGRVLGHIAGKDAGRQLDAIEAGLALAQEFGGAYPFVWHADRNEAIASAAFKAIFGLAADEPLTADAILRCVHPDDSERVITHQAKLTREGGHFDSEFRIVTADGSTRWILARGRAFRDPAGGAFGLAGVNLDITERKLAELALAEREEELAASETRLRTTLNAMPQVVWSARSDGYHDFYNDRWYDFTGAPYGSTYGEGWTGMFHPDDQSRASEQWNACLTTGDVYEIEYRLRHRSGEYRWTLGRALPVRGGDGAIERWYGTCTDIHDFKVADEKRELVSLELSHRIKNIFSVVTSLIALSAHGNSAVQGFAEVLRARIGALSKAHNYVRPQGRESSTMAVEQTIQGLLVRLLDAYHVEGIERIRLSGADAPIGVRAATALALVIHELATNAVKYGSLSVPDGYVSVDIMSEGREKLTISWREANGPAVRGEPKEISFGTIMSSRAATAQLNAAIRHDWRAEGLVFELTVAIADLVR